MKRSKFIPLLLLLALALPLHAQFNTDRITAIGRNALYFEDYVLSIQYFNQVIRVKPYLPDPYQLRAIAKLQLGDYHGAMTDVEQAIRLNPFQHSYFYTRGFIYSRLDSLQKAEDDFTKALSLSPDHRSYVLMRADVRAKEQKYDSAMADLDYLLLREPKSASLHFEKGIVCLNAKDTTCALQSFETATRYDTQNPQTWSALGLVHLIRGENSEALNAYNRSVRLGTKWAGDYTNRGLCHYRLHNYRAALADYDEAIHLEPHNARTYFNRAMLRQELGDYNSALTDYNTAISMEPEDVELRYQRGTLLMQLRQWKDALADFDALIGRYPTFLPSYYLASQAAQSMGKSKDAYRYKKTAYDLEQQHDSIARSGSTPNTGAQVAATQTKSRDKRKEFSNQTAQARDDWNEDEYNANARGDVQNRYTDVVNTPNIVLSYYDNSPAIRRNPYSHMLLEELNRSKQLPSVLKFTTHELALTAEMINRHFAEISQLTEQIDMLRGTNDPRLPKLFFARAVEDALVQDYVSAIEDCTQAIRLNPKDKNIIPTFCRANWRFKLLEYQRSTGEITQATAIDFEIMLRDYDYIIKEQPDFIYAAYNKANMLCIQRNFKEAILHYNLAIENEPDFAEAYFNRGLTYIYTGENELGLADLSHAGELGIYQAYNLITRFQ